MIEGIAGTGENDGPSKAELANIVKKLSQRWFLVRNLHAKEQLSLLQPRWAMSLMLGPMTRTEIRQALRKNTEAVPPVEQAEDNSEPEEEP